MTVAEVGRHTPSGHSRVETAALANCQFWAMYSAGATKLNDP